MLDKQQCTILTGKRRMQLCSLSRLRTAPETQQKQNTWESRTCYSSRVLGTTQILYEQRQTAHTTRLGGTHHISVREGISLFADPGKSKVEYLQHAVFGDTDVARLEVSARQRMRKNRNHERRGRTTSVLMLLMLLRPRMCRSSVGPLVAAIDCANPGPRAPAP